MPTIGVKIDQENNNDPAVPINLVGLGIGDGFMSPPDTAVHADQLLGVSNIVKLFWDFLKG